MSNPHLIALAADIADYCVTNEYPFSNTTEEDEKIQMYSQKLSAGTNSPDAEYDLMAMEPVLF